MASVSLDLLGSGLIKLLRLQREIQRSLASEFMATRDSTGLLRPTLPRAFSLSRLAYDPAAAARTRACRRAALVPAGEFMPGCAARDQLGLALTRAQAFLDPEVLGRDLDRALDHPNQVRVHALQPDHPAAC